MNTQVNFTPNPVKKPGAIPGKPSNSIGLLFAVAAFAAAMILPEMGFISAVVICTAMLFISSARCTPFLALLPVAGGAVAFLRGGYIFAAVCATLIIASMIAGYSLNRGGFHKSLMILTFTVLLLGVGGVCFLMWYRHISPGELYAIWQGYYDSFMTTLMAAAKTKLHPDDVKLLAEQYETLMRTAFLYIPVIIAWLVELGAIISLRLAGLFHDITGSIMYPKRRRVHLVDKVFAVMFFASLLIGLADGDIVGVSAANVMLVLAVPAASAGVSDIRRQIILRRESGKRGFPFSVLIVALATFGMSIVTGVLVLGVIGCLAAFRKDPAEKKK